MFEGLKDDENFYPRSPCGERPSASESASELKYFYPRSPCGERQGLSRNSYGSTRISIHALLAESDRKHDIMAKLDEIFLSTLSLRRATPAIKIVIIAVPNFYPRSPCGERLQLFFHGRITLFISIHALLAESDHCCLVAFIKGIVISIHALLAESDSVAYILSIVRYDFYPRSPCGERQRQAYTYISVVEFLSTLSLRRATCRILFRR